VSLFERLGLRVLRHLDAETAQGLALSALRHGLVAGPGPITSPRLRTRLCGLDLPNPLGLAAGFDKDAVALPALLRAGFGFVEVGTVTPRPQPGNPRPRLFRLPADRAVINRFGFNSEGMAAVAARLARPRPPGIVGVNLGANRDSADRAGDYCAVLAACGPHADYATVNVSSPNTAGLRALQTREALAPLLARLAETREGLKRRIPLFLKISPDLSDEEMDSVAETARAGGIDALIATNTTVARPSLTDPRAGEAGGLSGAPLAPLAARTLRRLRATLGTRLPLIAAGGIGDAAEAHARLRDGATALQLYTALAYEGLALVPRLLTELDARLARDGLGSAGDAAGSGATDRLA
jgi:dihydroorotate dehydrogenase